VIKKWKKQPVLAVHQAQSVPAHRVKMAFANALAVQMAIAHARKIALTATAAKNPLDS
jgi:hypothetical protein